MKEKYLEEAFLLDFFRQSETEKADWKIGLEQEAFGFYRGTQQRVSYEKGIKQVLERFQREYDWNPVYEGEYLIALKKNGSSITLEPGGQLELSAAPLKNLWEIKSIFETYLSQLRDVSSKEGIEWYSLGYDPVSRVEDIPWMPKKRYTVMKEYLPPLGDRVHNMMLATCTAQGNFDFSDEEDMRKKMLVTTALSPMVTALFATSPFREKKLANVVSGREWTWLNIDPNRVGILDFVFKEDFSYQDYASYILDVPMMIIERDHVIHDFRGESFRKYQQEGGNGFRATEDDWKGQLGTVFPASRLKNIIEVRTCDAGPAEAIFANMAFWKGLLYDETSLNVAYKLSQELGYEKVLAAHEEVVEKGLHVKNSIKNFSEILEQIVKLAEEGLKRIAIEEEIQDESGFLEPIKKILLEKKNISDQLVEGFQEDGDDLFSLLKKNNLSFA